MADSTYASPSISQGNARVREWDLDLPQNAAKRQRRESIVERSSLLKEIQRVQDDIAVLKQEQLNALQERIDSEEESDEGESSDEAADVAALEALLKEMDDEALASLLVDGIAPASLDALLPFLGEDRMAILPPAKSAGIEGTGSGSQVDEEAAKIDAQQGGPTDKDAEEALTGRLERGEELLSHLATFTSINFHSMTSTVPEVSRRDKSRLLRTIRMKGRLPKGLGDIKIELEVGEDVEQRRGPQIVKLDVEIGDELRRALGEKHLQSLIQQRNLPAVMLSIRTLLPMADTRLRLFQAIAYAFPALTERNLRRDPPLKAALEGKHKGKTTMKTLVDPAAMGALSLQNMKGVQLDVLFSIGFNRWGHAVPSITVQPSFSPSLQLSTSAQETLQDLPSDFTALCAHATSPLDVSTSLVTTIQAFFGIA